MENIGQKEFDNENTSKKEKNWLEKVNRGIILSLFIFLTWLIIWILNGEQADYSLIPVLIIISIILIISGIRRFSKSSIKMVSKIGKGEKVNIISKGDIMIIILIILIIVINIVRKI